MQDPNFNQDLINQVSAQQLGVEPQAQPAPQVQAGQQDPNKKPEEKPTTAEQVQTKVSPETEGSKSKDSPFEFLEVDLGNGNKEAYTPEQVQGIASRYRDLNYQHQTKIAPIKGSVELLNTLREQAKAEGHDLNDEALTQLLQASLQAYAHNPEMGAQAMQNPQPNQTPERVNQTVETQTGNQSGQNLEAEMAEWEQTNAVTLPPMYKQAMANSKNLEDQVQQLTQLVQGMATAGQQTSQVANQQLQQAQATNADAGKQQIINNLQRAQNEFQFPDEAEKDFMTFTQTRGYDTWDLLDYNLVRTLATDFKNVQAGPELERLRGIAERRQAFTGNLAPAPGADNTNPPAVDEQQTDIDAMTDTIMKQKNMV